MGAAGGRRVAGVRVRAPDLTGEPLLTVGVAEAVRVGKAVSVAVGAAGEAQEVLEAAGEAGPGEVPSAGRGGRRGP